MKAMIDIVVLGIMISIVMFLALFLRDRYNKHFNEIDKKGDKSYSGKHIAIALCLLLPAGLWMIMNLSMQNLVLIEVSAGTLFICFTAYILTKNKLAILSGILYPLLYYYWWNCLTLNLIAMFIALGSILMVSKLIKPKQMLLICGLIIIYDFIVVYVTTDMVSAAHKILDAQLPMFLFVQLTSVKGVFLGIGDVLFAGLLVTKITEWKNYDLKSGTNFILAFCGISMVNLVVAIQITPTAVPATIPIMIAAALTIVFFKVKAF